MELGALLVVGLTATIVLWAAVLRRRPESRGLASRGVRNALIAAGVIALALVALVTLSLNGANFFGTISLGSAFAFGLLVGATVGAAFFWLNAVILAVGLLVRPIPSWPLGAVLATPVVIAALGFGYTTVQNYSYQQTLPTAIQGNATLSIAGARLGSVNATVEAICSLWRDGSLNVDPNHARVDRDAADIQLGVSSSGEVVLLAIAVRNVAASPGKGWEISPETAVLKPGWTRSQGSVSFNGIVPLDASGEPDATERWSGSVGWSCPGA